MSKDDGKDWNSTSNISAGPNVSIQEDMKRGRLLRGVMSLSLQRRPHADACPCVTGSRIHFSTPCLWAWPRNLLWRMLSHQYDNFKACTFLLVPLYFCSHHGNMSKKKLSHWSKEEGNTYRAEPLSPLHSLPKIGHSCWWGPKQECRAEYNLDGQISSQQADVQGLLAHLIHLMSPC